MKSLIAAALFISYSCFAQSIIQIQNEVTVSSSVKVLDFKMNRNYLIIQNKGATDILVKFTTAHSANEGIKIISGGNWEPLGSIVDSVYIKSVSGSNIVTVIEGSR